MFDAEASVDGVTVEVGVVSADGATVGVWVASVVESVVEVEVAFVPAEEVLSAVLELLSVVVLFVCFSSDVDVSSDAPD